MVEAESGFAAGGAVGGRGGRRPLLWVGRGEMMDGAAATCLEVGGASGEILILSVGFSMI